MNSYPVLLEALFRERFDDLRARLAPLDAGERRRLYQDCKGLLKLLGRACRWQFDAKPVKPARVYRAIQGVPPEAALDRAAQLVGPGSFFANGHYGHIAAFYRRLQALTVGLASKSTAAGAFRRNENYPHEWGERYVLALGRILLDRPEPWVPEALAQVFENIERWTGPLEDNGAARLLQEAGTAHPEWAETLRPHYGRVMRRDGFRDTAALRAFDAELILAGLAHQSSDPNDTLEPVALPEIVDALLSRMRNGSLPRDGLIEATLHRLHGPLRPSIAKGWIAFFQRLALSDREYEHYADGFVDMLNAPSNAASKLALQTIGERFLDDAERAPELLPALGYLLQHPTQLIAKTALRHLKTLVKTRPDLGPQALEQTIAGLASPNQGLRSDLIRWLASFQPGDFSADARGQLEAMKDLLPAADLEPLAHLLSEPLAPAETIAREPLVSNATLAERIEAIRAKGPSDEVMRHRLTFLENWLETGCRERLEPLPPTPTALQPADFKLHESAEALALDIARARERLFTHADYDRILAGILHYRHPADPARIRRILAPLLDKREIWNRPPSSEFGPVGSFGQISALLLANAWIGQEPLSFCKGSLGAELLNVVDPELLRRLQGLQDRDVLLSTPTHTDGWLLPEIFAERYLQTPADSLDPEDLSAALYRLPALPEKRERAWHRLADPVGRSERPVDTAVVVALGPDEYAQAALQRLLALLQKTPPVSRLVHGPGATDESGIFAGLRRFFRPSKDTGGDGILRLLVAALHCRHGLADSGINERASWLVEQLAGLSGRVAKTGSEAPDFIHDIQNVDNLLQAISRNVATMQERLKRGPPLDGQLAAELLFHPRPVTREIVRRLFRQDESYFGEARSDYPPLLGYLLARRHTYFLAPGLAADLAYRFPSLAQRFFEAGLCRQNQPHDYERELILELVGLGKLPQVDMFPYVDLVTEGLVHEKAEQRERRLDILLRALADGRITPMDLAIGLATRIRQVQEGFGYLDKALASLAAADEAGRASTLLAVEKALAGKVTDFPPRKLSLLLDRLGDLLTETQRSVHEPAARETLEQLAGAGKRSVARDKARTLLDRPRPEGQVPLEILAVAGLVI